MSYSFRDDNPVLGRNATIELPGGAAYPTNVKVVLFDAVTYFTATTGVNQLVFTSPSAPGTSITAPDLGQYTFVGFAYRYQTSSTSGTIMIEKTPSGTAVGSGTNLLSAAVSTSGTALNTTLFAFPSNTLAAATNLLSNGDSLSLVFGGTQTSLTNLLVTIFITRAT